MDNAYSFTHEEEHNKLEDLESVTKARENHSPSNLQYTVTEVRKAVHKTLHMISARHAQLRTWSRIRTHEY